MASAFVTIMMHIHISTTQGSIWKVCLGFVCEILNLCMYVPVLDLVQKSGRSHVISPSGIFIKLSTEQKCLFSFL